MTITANNYCVTDALADVTLLDKQIPDKINRATFDMISKEKLVSPKLQAQVEEFKQITKSGYQSIKDLIKRRHVLKSAIIKSNAGVSKDAVLINTVTVLGESFTIAEIIERRKSLVLEKTLLERLKQVNFKIERELVEATKQYNIELQDYIGKLAALKDVKADNSKFVEECTKTFSPTNQPIRVDPIGIVGEIERLQEYVDAFNNELDRAISKSNATTLLEV